MNNGRCVVTWVCEGSGVVRGEGEGRGVTGHGRRCCMRRGRVGRKEGAWEDTVFC